MTRYAEPRPIVSTDWLLEHADDDDLVVVEVGSDLTTYEKAHIPGALFWSWRGDLFDADRRDLPGLSDFTTLMGRSGITTSHKVILYGDSGNSHATWAFWLLKIYGHDDVRLLNGGRSKWLAEDRPVEKGAASTSLTTYKSQTINSELRAFLPQVKLAAKNRGAILIDARSTEEFIGESADGRYQRVGHIPNARNVPWDQTVEADGTFKDSDELLELYRSNGVPSDRELITYCAMGERSSHSWFVLKHLLGYPHVKNYDGSWAEWGNLVGVAVKTGPPTLVGV